MAAPQDIYLLGIICNIHESAAALVKNGVLIAAAEEERFSRKKHANWFAALVNAYCLREAGISLRDVSTRRLLLAAVERTAEARVVAGALFSRLSADLPGWESLAWVRRHALRATWRCPSDCGGWGSAESFTTSTIIWRTPPVPFLCRRMSRRPSSPPIFVVKTAPPSLPAAAGIAFRALRRFYLPHSLGMLYASLTQFLGYQINVDEYKVMGLAAYGQPRFADTFARMVRFENGRLFNDRSWFNFHTGSGTCYSRRFPEAFGPPCPDEFHVDAQPYPDLAASGQNVFETLVADLAKSCRERNSRGSPVHGGRGGAEFRGERTPPRATDLPEHLDSTRGRRCGVFAWHSVSHLARIPWSSARFRDGARVLGAGIS